MEYHLPVGFKFLPTDEELIDFYLRKRLEGHLQENSIIMELDVYFCHPEMLLEIYLDRNDEGYFFTKRGPKYGKGKVVNRVAGDGFWKMTSVAKPVCRSSDGCVIGKKHVLKYFGGTPSKKETTDWIMYEYEIIPPLGETNKFQDLVLCKVYKKRAKKIEKREIDFNFGWEDGNLNQQQNSFVPVEAEAADPPPPPHTATNYCQWNAEDDKMLFDTEHMLQILG